MAGWFRNPSLSASQLYVATHPRVYRLWVGFLARLLLHKSYPDTAEYVRAVIELAAQARAELPRFHS